MPGAERQETVFIGISVLDTREIQGSFTDSAHEQWSRHITQSFHFTIGQGKSVGRARGRFLFSDTKPSPSLNSSPNLRPLLKGRNIYSFFTASVKI